jgi:hypothetical protein
MNKCSMCNADLGTANAGGLCATCRNKLREQSPGAVPFGWACPRCGTVHAPWVAQCQCRAPVAVTVSSESGTSGGQEKVERLCVRCEHFECPASFPPCYDCFEK